MDFQESEDMHRNRETERETEMERERELKSKRGEKGEKKKTPTCMCLVSGPSYIKQTQINHSAIAFSKRTADRPVNEG